MSRHCSECRRMILSDELAVPDDRGGVICEDCQREAEDTSTEDLRSFSPERETCREKSQESRGFSSGEANA